MSKLHFSTLIFYPDYICTPFNYQNVQLTLQSYISIIIIVNTKIDDKELSLTYF